MAKLEAVYIQIGHSISVGIIFDRKIILLHKRLQQGKALCLQTTATIKYISLPLHQSMHQGAMKREVKH